MNVSLNKNELLLKNINTVCRQIIGKLSEQLKKDIIYYIINIYEQNPRITALLGIQKNGGCYKGGGDDQIILSFCLLIFGFICILARCSKLNITILKNSLSENVETTIMPYLRVAETVDTNVYYSRLLTSPIINPIIESDPTIKAIVDIYDWTSFIVRFTILMALFIKPNEYSPKVKVNSESEPNDTYTEMIILVMGLFNSDYAGVFATAIDNNHVIKPLQAIIFKIAAIYIDYEKLTPIIKVILETTEPTEPKKTPNLFGGQKKSKKRRKTKKDLQSFVHLFAYRCKKQTYTLENRYNKNRRTKRITKHEEP
jgi:hypothetical protein